MKKSGLFIVFIAILLQPCQAALLFFDDFNGTQLGNAWTVQNEYSQYYSVSGGTLNIQTQAGDIVRGSNSHKNLFVINNPTNGNFIYTARIDSFSLTNSSYAQFDLLAYDNDNNHVRSIYGHIGARRMEFGKEVNAAWSTSIGSGLDFGTGPFYMRLKKEGSVYSQYWSTDGITFTQSNSTITYGDGTPLKLAVMSHADPTSSSQFSVDWVRVTDLDGYDPVPEPMTFVLFALSILGLMNYKKII